MFVLLPALSRPEAHSNGARALIKEEEFTLPAGYFRTALALSFGRTLALFFAAALVFNTGLRFALTGFAWERSSNQSED